MLQSTACFSSLSEEDGDEIILRLRMEPEVICSDSKYLAHLGLIVPCIIIYNFIIPILAIRKMNHYARDIYLSTHKGAEITDLKSKYDIN